MAPVTLLVAVSGALLPWVLYLAVSLPMDHVAVHWRLASVGFDATLAVLASAALAARPDSPLLPDLLMAGAVLLLLTPGSTSPRRRARASWPELWWRRRRPRCRWRCSA